MRQGHVAESFYIVVSGTVMSNVRDGKTPVVQEIKEGGCFGVSYGVNSTSGGRLLRGEL